MSGFVAHELLAGQLRPLRLILQRNMAIWSTISLIIIIFISEGCSFSSQDEKLQAVAANVDLKPTTVLRLLKKSERKKGTFGIGINKLGAISTMRATQWCLAPWHTA